METHGKPVIAIAHDYVTQRGGAERVVLALSSIFPEATIYTTLFDKGHTYPEFSEKVMVTSWLNRIPLIRRHHRLGLPLFPLATSSLKIDADIVIASSSAWAHGVSTRGKVLVYCYTPARFLYLRDQYLGSTGGAGILRWFVRVMSPFLKSWDQKAAHRATEYVAISTEIQQRIRDVYEIQADIVFPPLGVSTGAPQATLELPKAFGMSNGYYLLVSRLLPYKNVEHVVETFRQRPQDRLLIVGNGPLKDILTNDLPVNIHVLSDISDENLRWAYANCVALLAPSYEDFGLTVIEAAAWGKPSLALRAGGYLDTVVEGTTGIYFDEPTIALIGQALDEHYKSNFVAEAIVEHAQTFGYERFSREISSRVFRLLSHSE
ncbi:MAG: glycosyltransferase [Actinomycetales bacterium]|nr:glycosyltransferase [Actinomycetales bacterium]